MYWGSRSLIESGSVHMPVPPGRRAAKSLESASTDSESAGTVVEGEQALAALVRRRHCIDAMLMELHPIRGDVARRRSACTGTATDRP